MAPHPKCDKKPAFPARPRVPSPALRGPRRDHGLSSTSPTARFAPALAAAAAVLLVLGSGIFAPLPDVPDAGTPDAGLLAPEAGVMTDGSTGEEWAGIPIPTAPAPGQKTQCSAKAAEVLINGGCYIQTAQVPPCPDLQYEHGGKCWAAVGKRTRPAQSLGE